MPDRIPATPHADVAPATDGALDNPTVGIGYLVVAMFFFSVQDVIIKFLSGDLAVHQIVFVRSLIAIPLIVLIARIEGGVGRLRTRRLGLQLFRGAIGFCAYTAFYLSIASVPLGLATTLFFAAPLFVTALAVLILKEHVSIRRWLAVIVGFAGIVIALQPGADAFDPAALLAVLASLLYAFEILVTRRLGRTESGASLAFYLLLAFLILSPVSGLILGTGAFATESHPSLAFLTRAWIMPTPTDLALLAGCALAAGLGIYGTGQGYRFAQASVAVPFEYTSLFWAVLWGYLFWAEVPLLTTYIGIAFVVGSGLYIFYRESRINAS